MTTPEFEHFLLTRFNVRHETRASESWLRHRLDYFERLCRHSVMRQSSQNFRWIIYFDAERDEWFQNEIDRLAADVFEPVWVDGPLSPEKAALAVQERASADWVITTRVDNDDAIARDYIESVQQQFSWQELEFVNFQAGLQMSDAGELFHRSDPSGPFVSLIEKRSDEPLRGVYVGRHDRIAEYGPIRQVVAHPMWLQMVHGLNLGNALRGLRANPDVLGRYFDVNAHPAPVSSLKLRASQLKTACQLAVHVLRKPHRLVWVFRVAINRLVRRPQNQISESQ